MGFTNKHTNGLDSLPVKNVSLHDNNSCCYTVEEPGGHQRAAPWSIVLSYSGFCPGRGVGGGLVVDRAGSQQGTIVLAL